ncbi:MAG: hypothetical protein JWO31_2130 [Phycisphaerales bacterium]|nr:hypothetical protein [Phycisphaerales bacterium]
MPATSFPSDSNPTPPLMLVTAGRELRSALARAAGRTGQFHTGVPAAPAVIDGDRPRPGANGDLRVLRERLTASARALSNDANSRPAYRRDHRRP